jgi:hypothetical protein
MFRQLRTTRRSTRTWALLVVLGTVSAVASAADVIGYHQVKVDKTGQIVPWYGSGPAQAYDHVIRLLWPFWQNMRLCPNGVPYYLQHQVWKPNQDDSRGLGGDQINMALSSWNLLHGYLGDPALKTNMIMIADFSLKNGMSKPTDLWANLPYPYNTELHSGRYDGDMRAGKNFLQPDKAGSFGAELVMRQRLRTICSDPPRSLRTSNTVRIRLSTGPLIQRALRPCERDSNRHEYSPRDKPCPRPRIRTRMATRLGPSVSAISWCGSIMRMRVQSLSPDTNRISAIWMEGAGSPSHVNPTCFDDAGRQ